MLVALSHASVEPHLTHVRRSRWQVWLDRQDLRALPARGDGRNGPVLCAVGRIGTPVVIKLQLHSAATAARERKAYTLLQHCTAQGRACIPRLHHAGTAQLATCGQEAMVVRALVVEDVGAHTLADLSLAEREQYAEAVWEVCAAVWREGVAHGDMRPENFAVDRDAGSVHLIDFEHARLRASQWDIDKDVYDLSAFLPPPLEPSYAVREMLA